MPVQVKKHHPALKHAGYAATGILPGENLAEFEKLHRDLIAELGPNGALENDIVATIARLFWRKKNLKTFRIAELARARYAQITDEKVPEDKIDYPDLMFGTRALNCAAVPVRSRSATTRSTISMLRPTRSI
jgi:hypothetical protein